MREQPLSALVEALRAGTVASEEVVNDYLQQIEKLNGGLLAFLSVNTEGAKLSAKKMKGTLFGGLPICLPDVVDIAGLSTSYGSLLLADKRRESNATEIDRLLAMGLIPLGKTNISEFGLDPQTVNKLCDPTKNPHYLDYTPGGPNGGSAAAVAAGMSPLAFGTDYSGSIRISSTFCGLAGFLPTAGAFSFKRTHYTPYSERHFLHRGFIAKSFEDIRYFHSQLTKTPPEEFRPLKIAYSPDLGFMPVDPAVAAGVREGVTRLRERGHGVEEISLDLNGDVLTHFRNIVSVDRHLVISNLLEAQQTSIDKLSPVTQEWMRLGYQVTGLEYSYAEIYNEWLKGRFAEIFSSYDALVTPVSPVLPYLLRNIPKTVNGINIDPLVGLWGFTIPFNIIGYPVAALVCSKSAEGLPIGLQLVGKPGKDAQLLAAASHF